MSLEKLSQQISATNPPTNKLPPVELWDPPYCGEIDLRISSDGQWFYNGTVFKRLSLVKLFASVLKKENDEYFLVTPVEKVKITVDDAPFILTQWQWSDETNSCMLLTTNLDDNFALNEQHPLTLNEQGEIYVLVRRNLPAKVHRNVYYQWVDIAQQHQHQGHTHLMITSAGKQFSLGVID